MKKLKSHIDSFSTFQLLGYLIGGMAPIVIALGYAIITGNHEIMASQFVLPFSLYTVIGLLIGSAALLIDRRYSHDSLVIRIIFPIQALFSFLFIHFLVIYTGGPKSSVFALSYLYLPAIVGYTYGKGVHLKGATIFIFVSFVLNLFFLKWQYDSFINIVRFGGEIVSKSENIDNGKWVYLWVFTLQIGVTSIIASKKSLVDDN